MTITFTADGVIGDRTIEGRGKGPAGSHANGEGGLSTGIGVGARTSGPLNANQSPTATDLLPTRIGGGVKSSAGSSNSNDNLGSMVVALALAGGTGYANGVYVVDSTGGGALAGEAQVQLTVAGGVITQADVTRAGSGFTSPPAFALTALGAGTGATLTATIGREGDLDAFGAGFGTNKGTRHLVAAGVVAVNAAVSGGYLNRSGRIMAAGDATWAVAP